MEFPTYNPHLKIGKSLISGANLGLFALCDIPPNLVVDVYHGRVFTPSQKRKFEKQCTDKELATFHEYVLWDDENELSVVPFQSTDCYARFANDICLLGRMCNVEYDSFAYKKDQENLMHDLPQHLKQATMCIRSLCHIKKGDEIYACYGNQYWITKSGRELKQKLSSKRRKYRTLVRTIKTRILNKSLYLATKKRKISDDNLRVAVWPSPGEPNKYVMAQWNASTDKARSYRESGILDHDPKRNKWLVLNQKTEPLAHPCTRIAFTRCALPVL